jgi:hypothetical protein
MNCSFLSETPAGRELRSGNESRALVQEIDKPAAPFRRLEVVCRGAKFGEAVGSCRLALITRHGTGYRGAIRPLSAKSCSAAKRRSPATTWYSKFSAGTTIRLWSLPVAWIRSARRPMDSRLIFRRPAGRRHRELIQFDPINATLWGGGGEPGDGVRDCRRVRGTRLKVRAHKCLIVDGWPIAGGPGTWEAPGLSAQPISCVSRIG